MVRKKYGAKFERCRDRFTEMWLAGDSTTQIMRTFDVSIGTVQRWLLKLNLPNRMQGNHPRPVQVEYMKRQAEKRLENCQSQA